MATALKEHQFEILPDVEAESGFVFGIGAEVSVNGDGFDPASGDWISQDQQNTRSGNTAFGRDVLGASTWTWAGHVDREDVEGAVDTLGRFKAAWRPQAIALKPGAQVAMRYQLAGRTRRVFGRPRRFDGPPTNLILNGYLDLTFDFACVDAFTYDDQETIVDLPTTVSGESNGGFTFPLVMPAQTQPNTLSGEQQIIVGGNARAYPVVTFYGPWTNPSLETDNWNLSINGGLTGTQSITVDLRPWARTITDQNGDPHPERLAKRTYLEDMFFEPGQRPVLRLGGVPSAGSYARLRWRNTHHEI